MNFFLSGFILVLAFCTLPAHCIKGLAASNSKRVLSQNTEALFNTIFKPLLMLFLSMLVVKMFGFSYMNVARRYSPDEAVPVIEKLEYYQQRTSYFIYGVAFYTLVLIMISSISLKREWMAILLAYAILALAVLGTAHLLITILKSAFETVEGQPFSLGNDPQNPPKPKGLIQKIFYHLHLTSLSGLIYSMWLFCCCIDLCTLLFGVSGFSVLPFGAPMAALLVINAAMLTGVLRTSRSVLKRAYFLTLIVRLYYLYSAIFTAA